MHIDMVKFMTDRREGKDTRIPSYLTFKLKESSTDGTCGVQEISLDFRRYAFRTEHLFEILDSIRRLMQQSLNNRWFIHVIEDGVEEEHHAS